MRYSLMLVLKKTVDIGSVIEISSIASSLVKQQFEQRIENWVVDDDGFTSDMAGKSEYIRCEER